MIDFSRGIVVIPTLNERVNSGVLIPDIFDLMPDISILIVDDASTDGTPELVDSLREKFKNLYLLERKSNFGYGRSSIDGFRWVLGRQYKFLVTMDADFSHDPRAIPEMIRYIETHDAVVGSRYTKGGGVRNWHLFRRLLSKAANAYVRIILRLPITDVTTGFNAYRADVLKRVRLDEVQSDGYAFLVELKFRLYQAGCRFAECPIIFSERREGKSKMSGKIIWESIWLPWKLL